MMKVVESLTGSDDASTFIIQTESMHEYLDSGSKNFAVKKSLFDNELILKIPNDPQKFKRESENGVINLIDDSDIVSTIGRNTQKERVEKKSRILFSIEEVKLPEESKQQVSQYLVGGLQKKG